MLVEYTELSGSVELLQDSGMFANDELLVLREDGELSANAELLMVLEDSEVNGSDEPLELSEGCEFSSTAELLVLTVIPELLDLPSDDELSSTGKLLMLLEASKLSRVSVLLVPSETLTIIDGFDEDAKLWDVDSESVDKPKLSQVR